MFETNLPCPVSLFEALSGSQLRLMSDKELLTFAGIEYEGWMGRINRDNGYTVVVDNGPSIYIDIIDDRTGRMWNMEVNQSSLMNLDK